MLSDQISCLLLVLISLATAHSACGPNHFQPDIEEPVCPQLEDCALACQFGRAKNRDGCEVCECAYRPCDTEGCTWPLKIQDHEKPCEEMGDCDRRPKYSECPVPACQTRCPYSERVDQNGCRFCACNPSPCNNFSCELGKRCIVDLFTCPNPPCDAVAKCVKICPLLPECTLTCAGSDFKRDADECRLCECKDKACDDVKCPLNQHCEYSSKYVLGYNCACDDMSSCQLECKYGFHKDINGCPKCQCVLDPCKNVTCPGKLACQPTQLNVCFEKPCPFKAKCV